MFDFLKRKKSVIFQVFDPDGDLVMSDGEPITKMAFNEIIKLDPDSYPPGKYECVCNDQAIWTRIVREKVVKPDNIDDNESYDPLSAVKDSVERISKERETLTDFKSSLDSILGEGNIVDLANAPQNLRDGISKGMGAAVYSGLLKNDTEAVDKVFGLMDGVTATLNGFGMYLASESSKPDGKIGGFVNNITDKIKPTTTKQYKQETPPPKKVNVVSVGEHKKTITLGKPKIEKVEPKTPEVEVEHDPFDDGSNDVASDWHEPVFDDIEEDEKHGND